MEINIHAADFAFAVCVAAFLFTLWFEGRRKEKSGKKVHKGKRQARDIGNVFHRGQGLNFRPLLRK